MIKLLLSLLLHCSLCDLHRLTPEDNIQMEKFSQMTVSPTNNSYVYVTSQFNLTNNNAVYKLVHADTDGNVINTLQLDTAVHDLAWTPNSRYVSFLNDTDETSELYLYDCTSNTVTKVTEFERPIDSVRWSSAGPYFVFSSEVYPSKTMHETREIDDNKDSDAMIFDHTFVYHWDTWETGKFRHVMYMKVTEDADAGYKFDGEIHDIMFDFDGNCPSRPWGGIEEYSIDPLGTHIAFTTQLGTNQAYNLNKNIYLATINPDAEYTAPEKLTEGVGRYNCPIFVAEDGGDTWTHIYYQATHIANYEADQIYIRSYARDSKMIRELPIVTDNSYDTLTWTPLLPGVIFAGSNRRGTRVVVPIEISTATEMKDASGNPIVYPKVGSCLSFAFLPGTTDMITTKSSYVQPTEVFLYTYSKVLAGEEPEDKQLTFLSEPTLSQCYPLRPPERITYIGANGDEVEGFYFAPVDVQVASGQTGTAAAGKHPLIMYIHGGPEGSWMDEWSDRWNPEVVVNQGYALFAPNFHGGDAYGQWFTESIIGNWGTLPYEDILAGLTYIVSTKADVVDPDRIAAMGASYGGYMMNWLQTHTNIFKAIVCHDGIWDLQTQYYETDELYSFEIPHKGTPWTSDLFNTFSPSFHCQNPEYTQTPELIIHGGRDFRCTITQAYQAFQTLQAKGVPSRFVYFPNENHWVLNKQNSQRWHQEVFAWLRNYV